MTKTDHSEDVDLNEMTAIKSVRDELTVHSDNILFRNHRIALQKSLRQRDIDIAYAGHQGVVNTKWFYAPKCALLVWME